MPANPVRMLVLCAVMVALAWPVQAQEAAEATTAATPSMPGRGLRGHFRRGLETISLQVSDTRQMDLPSGPRSRVSGPGLRARWTRFVSPRVERGVELGVSHLEGKHKADTDAWSLMAQSRQYFHVERGYAAFWEGGVGVCDLTHRVVEQATNFNFVERLGMGVALPAGQHSFWSAQYSFMHVSNAGISQPNVGLNCVDMSLGYSGDF